MGDANDIHVKGAQTAHLSSRLTLPRCQRSGSDVATLKHARVSTVASPASPAPVPSTLDLALNLLLGISRILLLRDSRLCRLWLCRRLRLRRCTLGPLRHSLLDRVRV
jgi:hypothetical protein